MKLWLKLSKKVIKSFLLFFGGTLIGTTFGIATVISGYNISSDMFMQLLCDRLLASLFTPIPYGLAFLATIGEYTVGIIKLYKSRKAEFLPSIDFKLNDFLTVRFEHNKSIIYVMDEPIAICKYLLMNIPTAEVNDYDSIDEASEFYSRQLEKEITPEQVGLTPEEEFKGHCSNLQVWVENSYDTCLLHRNLAFPLLKKLSSIGDPVAKEVLAQEILDRFKSGSTTVQTFLVQEGYFYFLNDYKVEDLFEYIIDKHVLYWLGGRCEALSDLKLEIKVLNRLIEMDPINYRDHMVLANRYVKSEDTLMAKLVLRKVLMLYPNDAKALFFLAHLYLFEGNINRTKQTLDRQKNSEFKLVKHKNLSELDKGMRTLLSFMEFDYYPDPFDGILDELFADW